ncbi:ankyrin repeat-containing protein At5g02620-like [Cornus florida]|uniref:ankyrin repeat-containing protein At5g02620-like n=1 Tax=Cornus florida TaxID=4283 RepID=UPI0028A0F6BC|nr:ankyrin repeat-containing protein At5g02620-like [Cornus florida]XP_059660949.1 ankyrin repeat-containing protein At5g02620-like [Cornus florida]
MVRCTTASNTARKDDVELDKRSAVLYKALMKEETPSKLVELCQRRYQYPEGPLHVLTIHGDTVLHMAAHTAKADSVIQLLEMLPENENCKLTRQNAVGNTILHEAATCNKLVPAAKKMLEMAPDLLNMRNHIGETAFFNAARYGQIEMFLFLGTKVGDQNIEGEAVPRKTFYQRDDNATVLHIAVIFGHFDLALLIAKQCEYLVAERDEHGMTTLQRLACNSAAFETRNAGSWKRLVYSYAWVWKVPLWEAIRKEMLKYESAEKLAHFLVELDNTSWKLKQTNHLEVEPSENQNNGWTSISSSSASFKIDGEKSNSTETPLFLAIKAGCVDIVEMILQLYPQAVEHVDGNGCNILHIAIKYRQLWVFDVLHQVGIPWRRLIVRRDRDLNTILHMVGQDCIFEPVLGNFIVQLQNDLLLFEHVKKICSSCSIDSSLCRNREGKTAEEVFVKNKEHLRMKAVEQVKNRIESCSWVGVFVSAVAFAAVYTVPGGLDQETGVPIFLNHPFFLIFIIADALCILCTLISLVLFFSVLISWFRFQDFKLSVPGRIAAGSTVLIFSVSMQALAFGASVVLLVQEGEQWTRIGYYTVAFLPFTVMSVSFVPSYLFLARMLLMSNIYIAGGVTGPRYSRFSFRSCIKRLFCFGKFITSPPSSKTPVEQTTPPVV